MKNKLHGCSVIHVRINNQSIRIYMYTFKQALPISNMFRIVVQFCSTHYLSVISIKIPILVHIIFYMVNYMHSYIANLKKNMASGFQLLIEIYIYPNVMWLRAGSLKEELTSFFLFQ